ncbi:Na+ driven multidrug efflux pump [Tritrichomonas foetus]|uniref:Na+ driven multidrug efflux pump n=1 Tax=Tritrichomonas foetus TaxID=1144522 RepID=A0A1J4K3P5_9EUKA|nr:Na+ driven multidrug efflux pump [Tritrichomonas foetus]|eukprot:OHT05999.1 Na+ driven multidrug efflux pump [Tritrichomonas foetus]
MRGNISNSENSKNNDTEDSNSHETKVNGSKEISTSDDSQSIQNNSASSHDSESKNESDNDSSSSSKNENIKKKIQNDEHLSQPNSNNSQTSTSDASLKYEKNSQIETNENDDGKPKMSLERFRLAGRPPLQTIFYLSSGPILVQFTGSLKGVIGSIWVSMALGEKALTAMSTIGVYDGISRSFGFFLSSSGSSKISQLYGQHKEDEASQVVIDMVRISVIFGILVPIILGLTTVPLAEWLGADKEIQDLCHQYMLPINIGTFTTILFIALGGSLQGEGRAIFFSILNVISLVANMCVLDPILLLAAKTDIWGASFAQAISEAVPGILLLILYFMGKFGVKPKLKQLFSKFSPHTLP